MSMGRTSPATDQMAFVIGNGPKTIFVTSGIHPHETRGLYTQEGAISTLISDTAVGRALRNEYTFVVYPTINLQGLFVGMVRSDLELAVDANRIWGNPAYTSDLKTIYQTAFATDYAAYGMHGILDYHDDDRNTSLRSVWYQTTDTSWTLNAGYRAALQKNGPVSVVNMTADYTLLKYLKSLGSPKLGVIIEHGRLVNYGVDYYRNWGRQTVEALIGQSANM